MTPRATHTRQRQCLRVAERSARHPGFDDDRVTHPFGRVIPQCVHQACREAIEHRIQDLLGTARSLEPLAYDLNRRRVSRLRALGAAFLA